MLLDLGGLRLDVCCDDPRFGQLLDEALGPTAPTAAPAPTDATISLSLQLELRSAPDRSMLRPKLTADHRTDGIAWRFARYDSEVSWSETSRHGEGWLQPEPIALRGLLQGALSVLLPEKGGLAVHAASLVHRDRCFLFPAHSGVGKSTLARCSGGEPPLADEISLVGPPVSSGGSFLGWASPFWSRDAWPEGGTGPCRGWPVVRLGFLEQDPTPRRQRLPPGVATDRLLQHVLCYGRHPLLAKRLLDAVANLAAATPAEVVGLPEGAPVWSWLDPLEGNGRQ